MWHTIENVAKDHWLSTNTFKAFCINDYQDGYIHSIDIDLLIVRYRQAGFNERLLPANDNT